MKYGIQHAYLVYIEVILSVQTVSSFPSPSNKKKDSMVIN